MSRASDLQIQLSVVLVGALIGVALASMRSPVAETRVMARLPSSRDYVLQQCDGLWQKYQPLIMTSLAPYEDSMLSIDGILGLHGWTATPQVIVFNNTVRTFDEPALNVAAGLVPLTARMSTKVVLPDMVLGGDIMDMPEDDVDRQGGPWFGYCNLASQTTNLLYPFGPPVTENLSCGRRCVPFGPQDHRKNQAVFLGSSTGWENGRRRAAVIAGMQHDSKIVSGFTQLIDISQETRDSNDASINETKAAVSMLEQVEQFKFVIHADGHCASIRLRYLLASDSVVFWIVSDHTEWYYPLLQPYVHYVPIRFDANHIEVTSNDILAKLQWAEANPARMSAINRNANRFAQLYLTEQGASCYTIQLFDEYSRLFSDTIRLSQLEMDGALQDTKIHIHA